MGIDSKHSYRFVYLRSEQWQTVRIQALARENGRCQFCGEFSISNDAHHVEYPESVWDTKADHLVILCRACHDFVHSMLEIHAVRRHSLSQFHQIGAAFRTWKTLKLNWLAGEHSEKSKLKKELCGICSGEWVNPSEFIFYEKFNFRKIKVRCCDRCAESASQFISTLDILPEKKWKVYEAWKRSRKIPA